MLLRRINCRFINIIIIIIIIIIVWQTICDSVGIDVEARAPT